jgi:uncharacterized protein (TIGR03435 family)
MQPVKKVLLCTFAFAIQAIAQSLPSFEAATVKPSGPLDVQKILSGKAQIGITVTKGRVTMGFVPVSSLIMQAYKIKMHQLSGPAWMNEERFDITATFPDGATEEQLPAMLQQFLADRFGLAFHWNSEEKPVYLLQVDKGGPKLKEAEPPAQPTGNEPKPDLVVGSGDNAISMRQTKDGMSMSNSKTGSVNMAMGPDGMMRMNIGKMTMAEFADALTQFVDRPVFDKTELKGSYQVALEMAMADMIQIARKTGALSAMGPEVSAAIANVPGASDPSSNSIFASIQKLGLRLESQKMPVQVLIVDKISKTPTEN